LNLHYYTPKWQVPKQPKAASKVSAPKKSSQVPQLTPLLPVRLDDLQIPHLSQLKKQLDEEIQHLTQSFQSLRAAQAKFRDCLKSLNTGLATKNANRTILVPLTASLYVPGKLEDTEKVLVDVGTGFFVEKDKVQAGEFYDGKVAELGSNLVDLEKIIGGKTDNLRTVEDGKWLRYTF
jgi:prefoldin alpha subunit